nr:Chain Z, Uncharacterized peptide [unidentified]
AKASQAA